MRVLFDSQVFTLQRQGGPSRYVSELIAALGRPGSGVRVSTTGFATANAYRPPSGLLEHVLTRVRPGRSWRRLNRGLDVLALRRGGFDLFHPSSYDTYFLRHLRGRPYVVTVLDTLHELDFLPNPRTCANKRQVAQGATRVLAISESTKRDVVRLLDVDPSRIDVTYPGSSLATTSAHRPPDEVAHRSFFLFVGQRRGYKNFERAVQALAVCLRQDRGLRLHCAGAAPFTVDERALFAREKVAAQVTHEPAVSDDRLRQLYGAAIALVYPSLYEGFGLPVLEAMALGCPVVTSNVSSMPEVGGDDVVYFDPLEQNSIRCAVQRVLDGGAWLGSMLRRATLRASTFSVERCARETRDAYVRALGDARTHSAQSKRGSLL